MNYPMTERYDLLIASMRAASTTVLYCAAAALALVLIRPLVRWILPPNDDSFLPVYFRSIVYTLADLMVVAPILALFILSK